MRIQARGRVAMGEEGIQARRMVIGSTATPPSWATPPGGASPTEGTRRRHRQKREPKEGHPGHPPAEGKSTKPSTLNQGGLPNQSIRRGALRISSNKRFHVLASTVTTNLIPYEIVNAT